MITDPLSLTDDIIAFDEGTLEDREVVELFSKLVQNGMAWTLQGTYGRTAAAFIKSGILNQDGSINQERLDELE